MPQSIPSSHRILILAKPLTEARFVLDTITQHDHQGVICTDAEQLCAEIPHGVGAVILSKVSLDDPSITCLASALNGQPAWSHLPLIVLLPAGEEISPVSCVLSLLENAANLYMIEAPVKPGGLVRTLRSALAYRSRQYRMRELMGELECSRHEAIEASRAKSDFLANMSHEIRTPLGAILGFTELMMDSGISKREKKDYMVAARRNGEMLSALIDDILDLSRMEAGRLEITRLEFSLGELLSEVVTALEPLASKKGLPLAVVWPKNIGHIVSDPIRLKQILINIVGNAIKFTSQGSVDLRVRIGEGGEATESHLDIEVEDTGIGVSPHQAARLFLPFTQADTSLTRKFGGTGLGLVLSQRLARAMGGDLCLKWSIPGGGSNFSIRLPVEIKSQPSSHQIKNPLKSQEEDTPPHEVAADGETASNARLPLANSKILLVDDSLDNQMLISRILRLLGAEVDLANDGVEGVEKALAQTFDVVLMDLQMPRLGGVEATRLLRAKGYQRPIVALTAHSMQEDRQRCMSVGCTDYLTKPVQRSLLVQVIERVSQPKVGEGGLGDFWPGPNGAAAAD